MIPVIERKYRALLLMERIQQLAGEAMVLEEECPKGPEQFRMHDCWVTLCKASDQIQALPTMEADLEALLIQSIENVREMKAHRATVIPFGRSSQ